MRRPVKPIDPADAPEYEADLDACDKAQDDAGDRERDERAEKCDNHGLLIHMDLSGAQHCSYCGKFIN